jgi:PIF1-like helicase/Helitron helicase-like domain at N-terminus
VLCYDILRRRHSLSKTNLLTSRTDWETTQPLLESLTDEKLTIAANQAAKHKPITDPAVKKLLSMVGTIGSSAPGSEQRKSYDLARMKSATVYFGLPQIFLTLNPGDNASPVALFYAGEKIDVKTFHPKLYSAATRLRTMLDNPLAVVDYFRNTVNTILKTMLNGGMFGELVHYHGPIEYLGRGPPHAHLLVQNLHVRLLTCKLWIKGAGSPQTVRDKAKTDLDYRQRLLNYIEQVCSECIPEEVVDDDNQEHGSRVFRPLIPPNHPDFDEATKLDVFDIVRSRQFHNEKHLPVCFKYRLKRKCRFRFPRLLVPITMFDESTGLILRKRDHQWLNNYNRWFSLVMRANHDCQYLFSQTEALAKIYYTMKYISKAEESTQSKLTIAAAVVKAFSKSARDDKGKKMLIRTYNKISSHREVGIPEMISHLLDYPETLTGAIFENIHTTHLLNYMKILNGAEDELTLTNLGDSSIVHVRNKPTIVSPFDDYAHRGPSLASMCMYDYVSLVYKSDEAGGLPFDSSHPQHLTHRQFVRKTITAIPTLLGKLLFLRPDSDDEVARSNHFCIVSALFVPWSQNQPLQKLPETSWEEFFSCHQPALLPRLLRYIDNLALLHKSKAEAQIDQLRLHALQGEEENADPFSAHLDMMGADLDEDDDNFDFGGNESTISLAVVQSALEGTLQSQDGDVREAMDANFANSYFETTPESTSLSRHIPSFGMQDESDGPSFTAIDTKTLGKLLKEAEINEETRDYQQQDGEVVPGVFISGTDVDSLIRAFSLNAEQQFAFRIICNHALGLHPPSEPQLLMGVFGEGGTGKSRLIDAIRTWFRWNGREKELVVTATTGTAAVKIKGTTVHTAVSISIDDGDGKTGRMSVNQKKAWTERRYMVIDEVSMLNCKVMEQLHRQLAIAKANPELPFGGVNLLFLGDFLQLPAVRNPDVYVDDKRYGLGHHLWRSLNAVVILREQMRQAGDPLYAAILSRVRLRIPTDEDIEILRGRIGAHLPNIRSVTAVVRRHLLRQAMNVRRLQEAEAESDEPITYCVAQVSDVHGMTMQEAYQVQLGFKGSKVNAIIPLLEGAPLLITKNISKPLRMYTSISLY